MKIKFLPVLIIFSFSFCQLQAQRLKILFDATKAETAANADWITDADIFNLGYLNGPPVEIGRAHV